MSQKKDYLRFSVLQRLEHWILFVSFTLLGVTGLPQKFVGTAWADTMIALMGGIEQVRIVHRLAASVLLAAAIYHAAAMVYKIFVQRVELSMLPEWQDVKDLLGTLVYNLGLARVRPKLPRYNFEEKMEYWAVVWGTALMALTGFMLWNPIVTAKFFPGSFIPAAKAAHGAEAILAVLAIFVWHLYGVHLRRFNKSMFNGKLSAEEMADDHALELDQIESGAVRPPAPAAEVAKRARIFIPVISIMVLVFLYSLYLFATFEDTAPADAFAAVVKSPTENGFVPITLPAGSSVHTTLKAYTDPTSCAAAGCHNGRPLETATASAHNQRIAAAGPNPWLAKLVTGETPASGETTSNCLVCHAKKLQADNLLASAQTVRPAGGDTCTRCHSGHPKDDVHTEVGLACVSCHTSTNHQIQTAVSCTQCHAEKPHADLLLNIKHARLDCRTCHVRDAVTIDVDASQAVQSPVTGFFEPTITVEPGSSHFDWIKDGQTASRDTPDALIMPVVPITIHAPKNFDPVAFALDGSAAGRIEEISADFVPSHGVKRDNARTCDTCHGPEGDFDFAKLGYGAEGLSTKSAATRRD